MAKHKSGEQRCPATALILLDLALPQRSCSPENLWGIYIIYKSPISFLESLSMGIDLKIITVCFIFMCLQNIEFKSYIGNHTRQRYLISAFGFATRILPFIYFLIQIFQPLAICSACTARFVSDLFRYENLLVFLLPLFSALK